MSIDSTKSQGMKSGVGSSSVRTITAAGLMVASLCAFAGAAQRDGAVLRVGEPEVNTVVSSSSESTFIVNENGRKIEVRLRDGEVVKATVDGKDVPKDRVKTEDGTLTIVDEQGNVVSRMEVPKVETIELGVPRNRGGGERRIYRIPSRNGQQRLLDQDAIVQMERQEKPAVMMGVRLAPVPGVLARHLGIDAERAAMIAGVAEGTPAAAAGLKPYDIVTALNGEKLEGAESIGKKLKESKAKAGDEIKLSVLSKGVAKDASLKLVAYDADVMAKAEWELVDDADAELPMSGRMFNMPMMEGMPLVMPQMEGMDQQGMDELNEKIQREIERAMKSRDKASDKLREIAPMMRERQVEVETRRGDMNERLKKLEAELEAMRKKLEQQQQPAKDAPANNQNGGGGR